MNVDSSSRHPIEELAEDFVGRYRRGERPSIEEYCVRLPEQAEEIRELFPALVLMENHPAKSSRGLGDLGACILIPPTQIGDYRIIREIGRGGMGIVYEAEHQGLRRRVALKVLPQGRGLRAEHLQRFERESQAAARLQHPHIVSVYEVGVSDGLHFFAMQYVEGVGLDEMLRRIVADQSVLAAATSRAASTYEHSPVRELVLPDSCTNAQNHSPESGHLSNSNGRPRSSTGLSNETRLKNPAAHFREVARIGWQVAEALSHAHDQGVVHRDIKPSNLLLDRSGSIWVVDFGLAKAQDAVEVTHTGDLVGTLRYMAPEQFHGWSDPRTDICGLGLTLYELLTLEPAHDAASRGELLHQIAHQEPPRPTLKNRRIPRDLETIVLKAIEREPSRRYQSAAEMADDLRRFLDDQPIRARRVTSAEYFWRWCRHNPALATTTAALVLAFIVGFAAVFGQWQRAEHNLVEIKRQEGIAQQHLAEAGWQKVRAETSLVEVDKQRALADSRFNQARRVIAELFDVVGEESLLDEPMMLPLRKKLLDALLEYDRDFVLQRGDDPRIQAELAASYTRVAEIANRSGARREALASHEKALEIRRKLVTDNLDNHSYLAGLAGTLHAIGFMYHELGDTEKSRAANQESIALWEQILKANPDSAIYRQSLASTRRNLGYLLRSIGEREEAWLLYEKSFATYKQLAEEDPDSDQRQLNLSRIYSNLGAFKIDVSSDQEALDVLTKSLDICESLVRRQPNAFLHREALAKAYNRLGDFHRGRRVAGWDQEAETWYAKSQEIQEALVREYPRMTLIKFDLANTYSNIADVRRHVGNRDENPDGWQQAIEFYRKGRVLHEELLQSGADAVDVPFTIGENYQRTAWCLAKLGQRDEATKAYDAAITRLRAAVDRTPNITRYRSEFGQLYVNLAAFQREWGDLEESVTAAQEARVIAPRDANLLYHVASELALTAKSYASGAASDDAAAKGVEIDLLDQSMLVLQEAVAAGFTGTRRLADDGAMADIRKRPDYTALLQSIRSESDMQKVNQQISAKPDDAQAYVQRGALYEKLRQAESAKADFERAVELYSRVLQSKSSDLAALQQRGRLHLRLNQHQLAIADFTRAMELKPEDLELFISRGKAYRGIQQLDRALEDFSHVLAVSPKHKSALYNRAAVYHLSGEFAKAIADYGTILDFDPNDLGGLNGLAWTCVIAPAPDRDPQMARIHAEKAVALAPGDWHFLNTLGTAYARLGKWEQAIDMVNRASAANADGATAFDLYILAMSHHQLGDVDLARYYFDEAVAWVDRQPELRDDWVMELRMIRSETEAVMRGQTDTVQ